MKPIGIHTAPADKIYSQTPCNYCQNDERFWDRIVDKTLCPHCFEGVIMGEKDEPICVRALDIRCAICHHLGAVPFVTFPLHTQKPVEIDLCKKHVRALCARRLGRLAFGKLKRELSKVGLDREDIFLLHSAFYSDTGKALQPAKEY